jgi:phage baseplate assembly protein W
MAYPDLPHFAFPFGRDATGKVGVVEQGTLDHVRSQEYAVVVTPVGYRDDRPDFGWEVPLFSNLPLDLSPLADAFKRLVPDSDATITEWADEASIATRHIRIEERG